MYVCTYVPFSTYIRMYSLLIYFMCIEAPRHTEHEFLVPCTYVRTCKSLFCHFVFASSLNMYDICSATVLLNTMNVHTYACVFSFCLVSTFEQWIDKDSGGFRAAECTKREAGSAESGSYREE